VVLCCAIIDHLVRLCACAHVSRVCRVLLSTPASAKTPHAASVVGIDLKRIKEEITTLLPPGQALTLLGGAHDLADHRHVSMAVAKAIRSDSRHEVARGTGKLRGCGGGSVAVAVSVSVGL
jgi:hypothetical protein